MPEPKPKPRARKSTEAEWEAQVVDEALGDALKPDGTIEFAKLREAGTPMTLDELDAEAEDASEDES